MQIKKYKKGSNFELEIAKQIRESGLDPKAKRMPRSGAIEDLKSDIFCPGLPIHLELKRQEAVNLDKAYQQALNGKKQQEIPIVISKKSRKEAMAYLAWSDLIYFLQLAKEAGWTKELLYSKRSQTRKFNPVKNILEEEK